MLSRDVRETGVAKKTRQEKNVVRSKHSNRRGYLFVTCCKSGREMCYVIYKSLKFQRPLKKELLAKWEQ